MPIRFWLGLVVAIAFAISARSDWTVDALPTLPSSFGAAVTKNDVAFLIGGFSEAGMHSSVLRVEECGQAIRVLASESPFKKRSFFPVVNGDDRFYLFGGFEWAPPSNVVGDVWSSATGADWRMEASDPAWEEREAHGVVRHNGHFYLFGGVTYFRPEKSDYLGPSNPSHLRLFGDVWESLDGFAWKRLIDKAPWGPRRSFAYGVKDGYIWIWGGVNDETATTFNDVWRSRDGVEWELVTAAAPWSPRAPTSLAPPFAGKLWVVGGDELVAPPGKNWHRDRHSKGLNDVWSSIDGVIWEEMTPQAPWSPRTGSYVFEMRCQDESMLGLYGGHDDIVIDEQTTERRRTFHRDLWVSKDGRTWRNTSVQIKHLGEP